jgi:hypothetical protein
VEIYNVAALPFPELDIRDDGGEVVVELGGVGFPDAADFRDGTGFFEGREFHRLVSSSGEIENASGRGITVELRRVLASLPGCWLFVRASGDIGRVAPSITG